MITIYDLISDPKIVKSFTKINRQYIKKDPERMSWACDLASRLGFDLGNARIIAIHMIYVHTKALGEEK